MTTPRPDVARLEAEHTPRMEECDFCVLLTYLRAVEVENDTLKNVMPVEIARQKQTIIDLEASLRAVERMTPPPDQAQDRWAAWAAEIIDERDALQARVAALEAALQDCHCGEAPRGTANDTPAASQNVGIP